MSKKDLQMELQRRSPLALHFPLQGAAENDSCLQQASWKGSKHMISLQNSLPQDVFEAKSSAGFREELDTDMDNKGIQSYNNKA